MGFLPGSSRPRRLEWEDDGVTVPWLATALAVYVLAVLNNAFWQECLRLMPASGVAAAVFLGVLFLGLASLLAMVFSLLAIRRIGRPVLAAIVFACAVAACLVERGETLRDISPSMDISFFWGLGLMGVLPAAIIFFVPIGRRRGMREVVRRSRFVALCGLAVLAASAFIALGPDNSFKNRIPVSKLVPYVLFTDSVSESAFQGR